MLNLVERGVSLFDDKVVFIGDCHSHFADFVTFIEYFLLRKYNKVWTNIIAAGLATETISGLSEPNHCGAKGVIHRRPCVHNRIDRIIKELKPKVIFACYGMGDGLFMPFSEERFFAYKQGIMTLINICRHAEIKLVIITPPIYEETEQFKYSTEVLSVYAKWLCSLPADDCYCVLDIHSKMAELRKNKKIGELYLTGDRIHWTISTHMFIAKTILAQLGIDIQDNLNSAGTISQSKLFRQLLECRVKRTSAWLKHIGYTREEFFPPGSGNIAASEAEAIQTLKNIERFARTSTQLGL